MTGFNMPPGCSPSDIPGNSGEANAAEAFADALINELHANGITAREAEIIDKAVGQWLWDQMGKAYSKGYADGQRDEQEAKLYAEENSHYHVQWFDPDKQVWVTSTMGRKPTRKQAVAQLAADQEYFWTDIQLRIVKVTEQPVTFTAGRQKRPGKK